MILHQFAERIRGFREKRSYSAKRISADELAYHQAVQLQVTVTNAMRQHWLQHLASKYRFNPPQDRIGPDGVITRAAGGLS